MARFGRCCSRRPARSAGDQLEAAQVGRVAKGRDATLLEAGEVLAAHAGVLVRDQVGVFRALRDPVVGRPRRRRPSDLASLHHAADFVVV